MEVIEQQWPWYVAGPIISLVMFSLIFFGKNFGMSSNLRTMCAIGGANRFVDFFKFDTKKQRWNLAFVLGSIIGGYLSIQFLTPDSVIKLAPQTIQSLGQYGIKNAGVDFLPSEIFGIERLQSIKGVLILIGGGVLVGFGTRYAGGCTSGHAISGLSNLQLPSLIAVCGFFIGGLTMVHLLMPVIF